MSLCIRATVHVRVNDVNEFAPVFVEKLYRVAVTEGKLYDRILRVEAIDGDCSPQYSQICYYEILTPNIPFLIDNDGKNWHLPWARHSPFPALLPLCQSHLLAELCYMNFLALLIFLSWCRGAAAILWDAVACYRVAVPVELNPFLVVFVVDQK